MRALMKMNALDCSTALMDIPMPTIESGQVLLRMRGAAFCGTDIEIVDGVYAWWVSPTWPLVLGHEGVGEVVDAAENINCLRPGKRVVPMSLVHCNSCGPCLEAPYARCERPLHLGMNWQGTICEYLAVSASACIEVPDTLPDADGAFLEPLAVVAHTLERVPVSPATSVAIVGVGPIALLHLLVLKALGVKDVVVVGMDGDERRLTHARSLGAKEALMDIDCTRAHVEKFDVVVEAGRLGSSVDLAFTLARYGARVGVKGLSQFSKVNLLPVVRKALILSGEAGATPRHYDTALKWISTNRIRPSRVATAEFCLGDAVRALEVMRSREEIPVLKI